MGCLAWRLQPRAIFLPAPQPQRRSPPCRRGKGKAARRNAGSESVLGDYWRRHMDARNAKVSLANRGRGIGLAAADAWIGA
jgi:hypothetical protein